ncbi:SsrA-binding protein SmpB [Atopobiaceae bacterium 24-176]
MAPAAKGGKKRGPSIKVIAKNRTARHEYFIDETFEAGIVLTGSEVKSLRERAAQITDAFVLVRGGEAWLHGMHIQPYSHTGAWGQDPDRKRKLLLHRRQIDYLAGKLKVKGVALVPLELYFDEHNRVKLRIGLARGKKLYDKRADMAKRDSDREIARALKERNRRL